jgi:DNA polymerase-4
VAVTLRRRIRAEIGLPASVGVAATKFVAKLASEAAKPDGLLHVPAEQTLEFLHPLPVRSLWGVGEATMAGLARLGIETVGDLAALPARVLERELGASLGAHLGRLANGDDPRPVVPDTDTKSVSAEHTFGTDLTTLPELVAEIRLLASRVGRRLRGSGLAGRTVTVKLRYGDFTTITRSETMPEPTDLTHTVLDVARRLVEGAWEAGPVRLLGVGVSGLSGSDDPVQLTVDDDPRRRALEAALDQVSERYGGAGVRPGSDLIRSKTRG